MRELYEKQTANRPRLDTDVLLTDYENSYCYEGFVDDAIRFIEEFQLLDPVLWHRFVTQFREHTDTDNGWRGEYWGKMMRGAALTYAYTKNEVLYEVLTKTVEEMIDAHDETGRISSFPLEREFNGWDLWCRKYVLLGMQYYLEICEDEELRARVIGSMRNQVDYLIERLGAEEDGKLPIVKASQTWRGLNSSSILEPVVRLHTLTGEQKYLDFAKHVIDCGGTSIFNVFDYALSDEGYPYQYPVTKAYEMTSCFEGLLEYYRITKIEKYKQAVVNFANRVLESDFTVIGSAGCTHELFDHSTVRQANTTNGAIAQETCVTVTLMKFFYQVTLLTGDTKYVDAFERAFYNAYLGAINTEKKIEPSLAIDHPDWHLEPLPFDSYSPLTAGTRGQKIGGQKLMPDHHYYGCCACIGSAGNGLVPKMHLLTAERGVAMNLYINGTVRTKTPAGEDLILDTETAYPADGEVKITILCDCDEEFEILLRNPAWSKTTAVSINGETQAVTSGYITLSRTWKNGDVILLSLDMRTEAIYPIPYGMDVLMNTVIWDADYVVATPDREDPLAKHHIALRRGPLMLAQENRLGYSVDDPIEVAVGKDGYVDVEITEEKAPFSTLLEAYVPLADGGRMLLTDYASAGKEWNAESRMAVWMLTK